MMINRINHKCAPAVFSFLFLILCSAVLKAQNVQRVWADEFDNAAIDRTIWDFETGPTYETLHYFTGRPENVQIVDGKLHIIALKESYQGFNYTAALLKTKDIFYWRYGRIEARIKLPRTTGFVPGFWMLPQEDWYGYWPWGGEIDVMEHPTNQDRIFGTCHTWQYSYFTGSMEPAGGSIQITDSETAFHIYAVEWTADKIDFFVDDQKYYTFDNEHSGFEAWPFDQPFYILLAMGVGGGWVGNPDATTVFPGVLEVDYVRVYQDLQDVLIYGPDYILQGSNALTYYAPAIDGAQYDWSVPNTAQIKSGQGTARMGVDWGVFSGDVELHLTTTDGSRLIEYPVVVSNNLLKNSGFEKGAKYWNKVGNSPADVVFTISSQDTQTGDNALSVDVKTSVINAWEVQLSQTNLSLKTGQTYDASFWAKSETHSEITAAVINASTYYLYESKTIPLTDTWTRYEFSFQGPGKVTGSLNIDLGGHTGKTIFDDFQISVPEEDDQNQVINADFSTGDSEWIFNAFAPAQASAAVRDGEYAVSITNGGVNPWDIFVGQLGFTIEKDKEYTVSFDAYAEAPRQISPIVGKNTDPWTVYSGSNPMTLTARRCTYTYLFVMNDPTDSQARLGFDIGSSSEDVFLDNIFLSSGSQPVSITMQETHAPQSFELFQNIPNPFNPGTIITFNLPEEGFVTLKIYDINGRLVDTLLESDQSAGNHTLHWNGDTNASGVYFYKISAPRFSQVNRMILMK